MYSFAAYRLDDTQAVAGDPAHLLFTDMLRQRFGWEGPSGRKGNFDHLPLVLQIDPDQAPELFDIPDTYWPDVSSMSKPLLYRDGHFSLAEILIEDGLMLDQPILRACMRVPIVVSTTDVMIPMT